MVRFFWSVRSAFNKKRLAFLVTLATVVTVLYFIPNSLAGITGNGLYITSVGYFGLFGSLLSFENLQQYISTGEISAFDLYFSNFFPLCLLGIAMIGIAASYKLPFLAAALIPYDIYAIYRATEVLSFSSYTPSWHAYAAIYILLAVILLLAVVILLLALYLPLKEPAPRAPRSREHKPTKSERIAELEARVRKLENRDSSND